MAQDTRFNRRVLGMLRARLPELGLDRVEDPRSKRGQRWPLETLLRGVLVGLVTGCKSLADLEVLSGYMSPSAQRRLGIHRRIPDTTLRTVLCRLDPEQVRKLIYSLVRSAHRRKALVPQDLPFGVVAMDGKATGLHHVDNKEYAPRHTFDGKGNPIGMMRTITSSLVSSTSKTIIDAMPINTPAEARVFKDAFVRLVETYGMSKLFRLISYDAGAVSASNATLVTSHGFDYLFAFKKGQKALTKESRWHLAHLGVEDAACETEDFLGGGKRVVRRLFVTEKMRGFRWESLKTVVRVQSETFNEKGKRISHENRYYASSLPRSELSDSQWLALVRHHWNVENNCHGCLDVTFQEDDHPWIERDAQGAVVMALLRRVAFDLLALFRSVTQRSSKRRQMPWRQLMRVVELALLTLTDTQSAGLRPRLTGPI